MATLLFCYLSCQPRSGSQCPALLRQAVSCHC